jgi:hypothetical protein
MRRLLTTALAVTIVAAPAALAAPGGVPGRPGDAGTTAEAKRGPKVERPAKVRPKPVAFIMRGVIAAVDGAAVPTTITVTPKGGNRHARTAIDAATSVTVKIGAATRISKAGKGKATFADLVVGDRVVVAWKAPRATALADLPEAKRVIDRGPVPAPQPAAPVSDED